MVWKKEYGTNRKEYYRQRYLEKKNKKAVDSFIPQPELATNEKAVEFTQPITQPLNIPQPIPQPTEFTQPKEVYPAENSTASPTLPKHKHIRFLPKPTLPQLIQAWKTQTNYACPPTCSHSYCSNCWYFADQELIDYKGGSM